MWTGSNKAIIIAPQNPEIRLTPPKIRAMAAVPGGELIDVNVDGR
jgi:hypothetical protein